MNIVIATQPLDISEIRDIRKCEVRPNQFIEVADVVIRGASLPISVAVADLNPADLAYWLEQDPAGREVAEIQQLTPNLEPENNAELRQMWDFSPIPKDMPIIDMDKIGEVEF